MKIEFQIEVEKLTPDALKGIADFYPFSIEPFYQALNNRRNLNIDYFSHILEFEKTKYNHIIIPFEKRDITQEDTCLYFLEIWKNECSGTEIDKLIRLIKRFEEVAIDSSGTIKISYISDNSYSHFLTKGYPVINEVETTLRQILIKLFFSNFGQSITDFIPLQLKRKLGKRINFKKSSFHEILWSCDFMDLSNFIFDDLDSNPYKEIFDNADSYTRNNSILFPFTLIGADFNPININSNWYNYLQYFFDFGQKEFLAKWKQLNKLRRKIAHNKPYDKEDLRNTQDLSSFFIDHFKNINQFLQSTWLFDLASIINANTINREMVTECMKLEKIKEKCLNNSPADSDFNHFSHLQKIWEENNGLNNFVDEFLEFTNYEEFIENRKWLDKEALEQLNILVERYGFENGIKGVFEYRREYINTDKENFQKLASLFNEIYKSPKVNRKLANDL